MSAPVNAATPSSTNVFDISVFMKDEFYAFPEHLRETIQEQHEALLTKLVRGYERGLPLKRDSEFTITRKVLSHPRDQEFDFQLTRSKRYSDISLANQAILQEFQTKVPKRKSMTTELELQAREQPMANPALAQRHSVRNGEMGWAFDKFECLSLHVTNVKGGRLRHESIWVERVDPTTVKTEPATVKKAPWSVKKENKADNARSTVTSTAVKVEDDDDDCYIVEGPRAIKGSKWRTAKEKESTAIKKETTANEREATAERKLTADKKIPMAYRAPTVTDVADGDDGEGCVIVDSPNAAK
jgi:hypothetical protein